MGKKRKPSAASIMDALTRKVKAIEAGDHRAASRGRAPNVPKPSTKKPQMIDAALKTAVRKSGRSYYDLGQAAGIAPSVILRFMSNDPQARGGDLRLSTAAKLAAEIGLVLSHFTDQ